MPNFFILCHLHFIYFHNDKPFWLLPDLKKITFSELESQNLRFIYFRARTEGPM